MNRYRIRSVLSIIASGNLTARAKLRRGDFLTQDADALNTMVKELDEKIGRMRDDWSAASKAMDGLEKAVDGSSRSEAKRRLEELKTHVNTWKQSLDQFETSERKPPIKTDQLVRNSKSKVAPVGAAGSQKA